METRKRVVISGYYGFGNTGDEAVLFSIIQALHKEHAKEKIEVIVLSNQPEKTSKSYGVTAINRWDIQLIYGAIKRCDLLISGGGSLLQDITGNKTIPYYLLIIKIAQLCKKEVVFYAQGYGPVTKGYSKFLVKRVLNKIDYIYVRDIKSKESLERVGINKSIVVTADPVIGMETEKGLPLSLSNIFNQEKDTIRVGIYLRSWENDSLLIEKIQEVDHLLLKEGIQVYFIPMQHPEDVDFLKKLPLKQDRKILNQLDVEEVLALTGQMDLVIGMRLHSLIMAVNQEIPVIALSYDPKVNAFMKIINQENCFNVEEFDPKKIAENAINQITNMKKEKQNILYKKQALLDKVYEPAKQVREILTK